MILAGVYPGYREMSSVQSYMIYVLVIIIFFVSAAISLWFSSLGALYTQVLPGGSSLVLLLVQHPIPPQNPGPDQLL